ncbi:MAG: gluconolaconase, partial [Acidobacteria bacterium]
MLLIALLVAALGWLLYTRLTRPPGQPPSPPLWPVSASTIAGNGTPGRGDGFVSAASFWDPFGVAVDEVGNTFVTDAGDNNMIRCITPTGRVTLVAGGTEGWLDGIGTAAQFHTPSGIAVAPDGTLVVADTGNNAIRRVTPEGVVTTVAGGTGAGHQDGAAATATFDAPLGVAVAADGRIFVADTYNDCVRSISPEGVVTTVAGGVQTGYRDGAGTEARFDTPSGIAIDARGTLFVADTGNN